MTTPILTTQSVNQSVQQGTPGKLVWTVKDSAGAPIDISTGWSAFATMEFGTARDIAAGQAITGTFTYGADGTLTLTQTNAQASALHTGQWPYFVLASNDSFTTQALAAKGTLLVASGV